MIDRQGLPLTDPKRAREGFLASIGGPKGYGLALMFGLLDGKSNGAASTWGTKGHFLDQVNITSVQRKMILETTSISGSSATDRIMLCFTIMNTASALRFRNS